MLVLLVSIPVSAVLVELTARGLGSEAVRARFGVVRSHMRAFLAARTDDERERTSVAFGLSTLALSLLCLLWVALLAAVALLAPWLLAWGEREQLSYAIAVSVVATAWWLVRRRLAAGDAKPADGPLAAKAAVRSGYGGLEKTLHRVALEPYLVRRLSFDLERAYVRRKRVDQADEPSPSKGAVYISGLARSGTTMLLRILAQTDAFRSLSYRDMPFVLAPNLWRVITRRSPKTMKAEERAHGDGILVDFDSPEAFEEVFWMTFCARDADSRCYGTEAPDEEALTAFADYRALVAEPESGAKRRYLSKNNSNLVRLETVCADPTGTVLVVYRNPVDTARSLFRMHQRFCEAEPGDPFIREYMDLLSHYEFGPGHLPFCFAVPAMNEELNPEDPNYWLDYWNAVYRHVLEQQALPFHLVDHDAMRERAEQVVATILAALGVADDPAPLARQIAPAKGMREEGDEFRPELLAMAEETYQALRRSPKNITAEHEST